MSPFLSSAVILTLSAAQPPQPRFPIDMHVDRDVAYGPHERNKLDIYVPKSDTPVPLVVWVHGGAWMGGSKGPNNPAQPLLTKGFAVAAINYRLSQHATFPAQIEDCKAAVRFLRSNAKKYNLDADHFGAWGASAGGHLVALLGTTGDVKALDGDGPMSGVSSGVQAVCDWFGPADLLKMGEQSGPDSTLKHDAPDSPESKLIGGPIQENKEKAARANPITYVTKNDPPFLIIHGDKDNTVPWKQSQMLHDALKAAGVDSTLVIVPGAGHGPGIGTPEQMARITAFFEKHLKRSN